MTRDPERLLSEGGGADPLERELLGSLHHVGPPPGAKDKSWRALAGQLAVAAVVGAATGSTAAATKAGIGSLLPSALSIKVMAALAASGVALGGGYWALRAAPTEAPPLEHGPVRSPATAPTSSAPPARVAPAESEPSVPIDEPPSRRISEPKRQDLLQAESGLLTEARAQLRSGNAAGAQAALDRLQAQIPKGVLSQEREVLAIEVLSARGNTEAAKRRAKSFISAHPNSPHSAKLGRFLGPP